MRVGLVPVAGRHREEPKPAVFRPYWVPRQTTRKLDTPGKIVLPTPLECPGGGGEPPVPLNLEERENLLMKVNFAGIAAPHAHCAHEVNLSMQPGQLSCAGVREDLQSSLCVPLGVDRPLEGVAEGTCPPEHGTGERAAGLKGLGSRLVRR